MQLDPAAADQLYEGWYGHEHKVICEVPLELRTGNVYTVTCQPANKNLTFNRFNPEIWVGPTQHALEGYMTSPRNWDSLLALWARGGLIFASLLSVGLGFRALFVSKAAPPGGRTS
jgi:hypothetical protein